MGEAMLLSVMIVELQRELDTLARGADQFRADKLTKGLAVEDLTGKSQHIIHGVFSKCVIARAYLRPVIAEPA